MLYYHRIVSKNNKGINLIPQHTQTHRYIATEVLITLSNLFISLVRCVLILQLKSIYEASSIPATTTSHLRDNEFCHVSDGIVLL